mmetsp:Transcript_13570/g.39658  ORF Transcript_13570/g.39658 Transcript_13570/m.39658 type:complete len:504 (+) Transcript_13570:153-1664(+)
MVRKLLARPQPDQGPATGLPRRGLRPCAPRRRPPTDSHGDGDLGSEGEEHGRGLLEVADPGVGEAGHHRPVDDAVVGRPAHLHDALPHERARLVVPRDRARLSEAGDGDLGQVDDGAGVGAAEVADVGEGEGAPLQVGDRELARRRIRLQPGQLLRNLQQRERADVLDVWHEQTVRRVHRDADVVRPLDEQLRPRLRDGGVELGKLGEGQGGGLDNERHQRELAEPLVEGDLLELLPHLHQGVHPHLVAKVEVRHGVRRGHLRKHRLPNPADRHRAVLGRRGRGRRLRLRRRRGRACRLHRRASVEHQQHVLFGDAPSPPGRSDGAQVELVPLRQRARRRSRQHLAIPRGARRGRRRPRRWRRLTHRQRRRCRCRHRRSRLLRLRPRVAPCAVHRDVQQRRANLGDAAHLVLERLDRADVGRRDLDRGLVALDLANPVELIDRVARLDEPLQHLHLGDALPNVGQHEGLGAARRRRGRRAHKGAAERRRREPEGVRRPRCPHC